MCLLVHILNLIQMNNAIIYFTQNEIKTNET